MNQARQANILVVDDKEINRELLLVETAQRLTSCVREMDTVARFGGDEFLVMLGELDGDKAESATQAGIVAEKIRATLAEPYLLKLERERKTETTVEHRCTSSIGVALFNDHAASTEEIIKWADMAMYQGICWARCALPNLRLPIS